MFPQYVYKCPYVTENFGKLQYSFSPVLVNILDCQPTLQWKIEGELGIGRKQEQRKDALGFGTLQIEGVVWTLGTETIYRLRVIP